jgi:hypothetical protein
MSLRHHVLLAQVKKPVKKKAKRKATKKKVTKKRQ